MLSDIAIEKHLHKAKSKQETRRRRIKLGYETNWRIRYHPKTGEELNIYLYEPKGIQNWHSTRELANRVEEIMDRNENNTGVRKCPINMKGTLQIRGKHLRRLKKVMPDIVQRGNYLYIDSSN